MKKLSMLLVLFSFMACQTGEDENIWDELSDGQKTVLQDMQAEECKEKYRAGIEDAQNEIDNVALKLANGDTFHYTYDHSESSNKPDKPDEDEEEKNTSSAGKINSRWDYRMKVLNYDPKNSPSEATFLVVKEKTYGTPKVKQTVQFRYNLASQASRRFLDMLLVDACDTTNDYKLTAVNRGRVNFKIESKDKVEDDGRKDYSVASYTVSTSLPYFFYRFTMDQKSQTTYTSGSEKGEVQKLTAKWSKGKKNITVNETSGFDCGDIGFKTPVELNEVESALNNCLKLEETTSKH